MHSRNLIVFGGTGSFGNKVATTLSVEYNDVTVFSRDEAKQHAMRQKYPHIKYVIGDVRDYASVEAALKGQHVVFYAAALKQVPSCEDFPMEAVKTNCLGVDNVCRAAKQCGVEKVVYLSTDKAVAPINAMGMSKALGEKIVLAQVSDTTKFACVRYGNILSSRGSVLPFWYSQMKQNQKLAITDPRMTRFLMNLKDSVSLVRYALRCMEGGEVFVWKAPAMTMLDFCDKVRERNNYPVGTSVVGIRPGEKIHEVLVCEDELRRTEDGETFITIRKLETDLKVRCKVPFTSEHAVHPLNLDDMLVEAEKDLEFL